MAALSRTGIISVLNAAVGRPASRNFALTVSEADAPAAPARGNRVP